MTSTSEAWCSFGIELPHRNWKGVVDGPMHLSPMKDANSGCVVYQMEDAVRVFVVETAASLVSALSALRSSMQVKAPQILQTLHE